MKLSAVFFDRDGTIIHDRHYLHDPKQIELIPNTGHALHRLATSGIRSFLVSNQSGIGRGYFTVQDLQACQKRLQAMLLQEGAAFTDARFCPHAPEERCLCRKPAIGMWESLREAYGLDPGSCAMIGDKLEDLQFGNNAGMPICILVMTGKGADIAASLGIDAPKVHGLQPIPDDLVEASVRSHPKPCRFFASADVNEAVDGLFSMPGMEMPK